MYKNALSLGAGKVEKYVLNPYPDVDQIQNLIDLSLAEGLSYYKIWFNSVNNFLRYPAK